jgi:hypothetical protein
MRNKSFGREYVRSEILSCRKVDTGTNRKQEGLEEHKGTDTEGQVDSWVLQTEIEATKSIPVHPYAYWKNGYSPSTRPRILRA